jgi:hypothetical protein
MALGNLFTDINVPLVNQCAETTMIAFGEGKFRVDLAKSCVN